MADCAICTELITEREGHVNEPEVLVQIDPAMVIRPGDTLIVRVPLDATAAVVHRMKERAAEVLSDVNLIVIAAEQLAIYRPDDTTTE